MTLSNDFDWIRAVNLVLSDVSSMERRLHHRAPHSKVPRYSRVVGNGGYSRKNSACLLKQCVSRGMGNFSLPTRMPIEMELT